MSSSKKGSQSNFSGPTFTESIFGIFDIVNSEKELQKHIKPKKRKLRDEKGIFREMDEEKKRGKKVIAE